VIRFRLPPGPSELPDPLRTRASVSDGAVELGSDDPTRDLHLLTGWALERGARLEGLEVRRPTLEDVYLELTEGGVGS
jgi:ABC-2 type transport system ATP-binding protein